MFSLDNPHVPEFIRENPEITDLAFAGRELLTMDEIAVLTKGYLDEHAELYSADNANPLNSSKGISCVGRACIAFGLASTFGHIQPSIMVAPKHAYNAFAERQGSGVVEVGNDMTSVPIEPGSKTDKEVGEVFLKPVEKVAEKKLALQSPTLMAGYLLRSNTETQRGILEMWFSKFNILSATNRYHAAKPQHLIGAPHVFVRHTGILLGQSAKQFVDHLTGHLDWIEDEATIQAFRILKSKTIQPTAGITDRIEV